MAWNDVRVDGQTLYDHEWNDVITEIGNRTSSNHNHSTSYSPISGSTVYLTGTSTQFVTGTSTQFTVWGSSTDYAPVTGSTVYSPYTHAVDSTVYHSTPSAITDWNVSTLLHGFAPVRDGNSTSFLSGAGTWVGVPHTETTLILHTVDSSIYHNTAADITDHNVSTLRHGFMAKLGGFSSKYFTDAGSMVEISTATYSTAGHAHSYAPITGSTVYVPGQSTDFVSGTSTQFTPTNYNKTVVLYAGNSMIATTTYATLGQALTTANTINFIYGQFTTVAGERMQWGVQMDQGWNSSNLYATFNWTAPLSSQTGNVVWELSAIRIGDNTTMHNAVASVITSTDAFQGSSTAQVFHRSAETTNFLVTGAGNYITFDLTRKIASDTLTTEAQILNIELRGTYASTY